MSTHILGLYFTAGIHTKKLFRTYKFKSVCNAIDIPTYWKQVT